MRMGCLREFVNFGVRNLVVGGVLCSVSACVLV